VYTGWLCLPI